MIHKNAGFTLVELLGVIAIMALLIIVGTTGALNMVNKAKKKASEEMRENLKQAAITYALDKKIHLKKCDENLSKEFFEDENDDNKANAINSQCAKTITVNELKNAGFFEDNHQKCDDSAEVLIYHYHNGTNNEYKAYVNKEICKN